MLGEEETGRHMQTSCGGREPCDSQGRRRMGSRAEGWVKQSISVAKKSSSDHTRWLCGFKELTPRRWCGPGTPRSSLLPVSGSVSAPQLLSDHLGPQAFHLLSVHPSSLLRTRSRWRAHAEWGWEKGTRGAGPRFLRSRVLPCYRQDPRCFACPVIFNLTAN